MGLERSSPWFTMIPVVVAAAMLVLIGVPTLATADKPEIAGAEDAVVIEVPIGTDFSEEDLGELVAEAVSKNPGMDIVLEPVGEVLSPEVRRAEDEARAAAEDATMERWIDEQVKAGVFVDAVPAPCIAESETRSQAGTYHVVGCQGTLVGVAGPSVDSNDTRAILASQISSLLEGIELSKEASGYYSMFTGAADLNSLTIDNDGGVRADLSAGLFDEMPLEASGELAQLFNLQLYEAFFQFGDVQSVELTVDGKPALGLVWYEDEGKSMTRGFYELLWQNLPVVGIEERMTP